MSPHAHPLRVDAAPRKGRCACGPAKPVPRPLLGKTGPHALPLRVDAAPRGGRCACGPAKPVPRPLLGKTGPHDVLLSVGGYGLAEPVPRPQRVWHWLGFFAALFLAGLPSFSHAQSVALAGMLGSKALLVVDGSAPKTVAPGETHQGVKVISTSSDQAVVEQAGKRVTLRVGDSPVSTSNAGASSGRGTRITLSESGGGHFMTAGQINGRAVQFMVDTGATTVAMSAQDAERAGIAYKTGQAVQMSTANGVTQGWRIKLNTVRIGDVEVFDVDAVVTPQAMPYLLLGNSFLSRFQMRREGSLMTLDKRY